MPTRHRRIGVTLDPELSEALALARGRLNSRSDAALIRELALLGAQALSPDQAQAQLWQARRVLDQRGATPQRADLLAVSRSLRQRRDAGAESASESLDWVRGSR